MTHRFWISFYSSEEDYRPIHDPPDSRIIGWWCSGQTMDSAVLCILVDAASEADAAEAINLEWPETVGMTDWRFFGERSSEWLPGDRFPLPKWSPAFKPVTSATD